MPTQIPVTMQTFFSVWQKTIQNSGIFGDPSNVIYSEFEETFPQSATPYVLICPRDFGPNDGSVVGSGRLCTVVDGVFSTIIRTRNILDIPFQAKYMLGNQDSTSVTWLFDQLMNFMHVCLPTDSSGNYVAADPPMFFGVKTAKRAGGQGEWAGLDVYWRISFQYYLPRQIG